MSPSAFDERTQAVSRAVTRIAETMGVDAVRAVELMQEMEKDGREDWSASDLLLLALAQLVDEREQTPRLRRQWTDLTDEEAAAAIEAYGTTEPVADIAARYGVSAGALTVAANQAGVRRPARAGRRYAVNGAERAAAALSRIPLDLDRCEHGRHAADSCFGCPGGRSSGNLFLSPGTRIGTDYGGRPIIVPRPDERPDPEAWYGLAPT